MWNCGSARIALIVLLGTGVSVSTAPECWLGITVLAGLLAALSGVRPGSRPWVRSRNLALDVSLVLLLLAGVALFAGTRMEGYARNYSIFRERVAWLRGTVVGFPHPSERGTDLVVSSLKPDSLCPFLPCGTRVLVRVSGRSVRVSPGDTLALAGLLRSPLGARNPGGFSEAAYLFQSGTSAVLTVPGFLRPTVKRVDPPRGFLATYMAPVHGWVETAIDRYVPGEERAFLLALVLGERGELTDEMKDAFRLSGIVHLISVSGLHTGLVAMVAFLFFKGVRLPFKVSLVSSVLVVWFYCGISGCSPPTLRSSVMVTCVVGSRLLGRGTGLVSPLCASCAFLLLVNPRYVTDVGFQLSYAATGSMLAGATLGKILKQWLSPPEWVWKYVVSTVLTTIVAQLGVLPILAFQFGSVSAVSIPANLLAIPVCSAALVSSFCSLCVLAVAPPLAKSFFSITWLLLRLCSLVAKLASSIPGASVQLIKPGRAEAVAFLVCFFVFLRKLRVVDSSLRTDRGFANATKNRERLILLFAGVGMVVCLVTFLGNRIPVVGSKKNAAEVYFLDVGQGDATAVRLPDGRLVLVDGGESVENWDSAQRVLVPFLRESRKKTFDLVLVTHFHSDHVAGVMRLLEQGRVGKLLAAGADTLSALSRLTHSLARKEGIAQDFVAERDTIATADGVKLVVVHPSGLTSADTSFSSLNDSSVVLVVSSGTVQFVLTGDAGPRQMDRVADLIEPGKTIVLKTPHHGGKGSLSVRFLEKARPRYVVFSVGRNNRFGHPAGEVVRAYENGGAKVFRTDCDGCVTFRVVDDSLVSKTANPATGLSFIADANTRRAKRKALCLCFLSGAMGPGELQESRHKITKSRHRPGHTPRLDTGFKPAL